MTKASKAATQSGMSPMGIVSHSVMALSLTLLAGCTWLEAGEYCYTAVEWQCDDCKDVKLKVNGEWVQNEESKEAENPL